MIEVLKWGLLVLGAMMGAGLGVFLLGALAMAKRDDRAREARSSSTSTSSRITRMRSTSDARRRERG